MTTQQLATRLADLRQLAHTVKGDVLADVVSEARALLDELAEHPHTHALCTHHERWVADHD